MTDTPPVTYPHIVYVESATAEAQLFVPAVITPPDPEPEPDPDLAAVTVYISDDVYYEYYPQDGTELDPYVDPQGAFVQRCILCAPDPDLPDLVVWYRPDADSDREEWVFELGSLNWSTPQANLDAYTAVITCKNGDEVTIELPRPHGWFARWRWQSAPRPVRRSYQTLADLNLIPHFDTTGLATGPIMTVSDYTPLALCGLPSGQGGTGAYPGLGIITGWQAQYLVRNAPETAWRSQAEATNSYPVFQRDPDTYAPVDILNDYPGFNTFSSGEGTPYVPKGPSPNRTDAGHLPSTVYVPFLLTGDPYHLEAMQFTCNYNQTSQPPDTRIYFCGRYIAWSLRAVAELVACTPDTVPSWLLPRSYWQAWMDGCKERIETCVANTSDPLFYVFHTLRDAGTNSQLDPQNSGDHVWQQNMLDLVTSWVASWRDDWLEIAEWCIHSSIDRASATSGWARSHASPYHMRNQHASVITEAMDTTSTTVRFQYLQGFRAGMSVKIDKETVVLKCQMADSDPLTWELEPRTAPANHAVNAPAYGDKYTSWAEAKEWNVITYDWPDGDTDRFADSYDDLTYPSYQLCALAEAIHAGLDVPGLHDAFAWLDGEVRRKVADEHCFVGDNWCVVPGTTRKRRRHRSDSIDPQHNARLQALFDALPREDDPH